MNLASRIGWLERAFGDHATPKHVLVFTHGDRYAIIRDGPGRLRLGIPWRPAYVRAGGVDPTGGRAVFIAPQGYAPGGGENPLDGLTEEQWSLVGPRDTIVCLCLPPRRPDGQAGEEGIS